MVIQLNGNTTAYIDIEIEQAFDAVMDYLKDAYGDRKEITDETGKAISNGVKLLKHAIITGEVCTYEVILKPIKCPACGLESKYDSGIMKAEDWQCPGCGWTPS